MSESLDTRAQPFGVWDLIAVQFEFADTGERRNLYGSNPVGRLILDESGYMMTIIMASERPAPSDQAGAARLFDTMMAYSGKYRLEGIDGFITSCDLAWYPAVTGTEQVRFYKREGDRLSVRSGRQTHPRFPGVEGFGLIEWRRATA